MERKIFIDVDAIKYICDSSFQRSHSFPFGHAVQSPMITQCQESGTDDEFCQHIANNYNLVVDTFRQDHQRMVLDKDSVIAG